MKNGKKPTLAQKKFLKDKGLLPDNWLVVKDTSMQMEVVSRMELETICNRKIKTKIISKEGL